MTAPLIEVQFDGLPGPTHHFGGLSQGNLASQAHAGFRSHPRAAARQSLAKMRRLLELGAVQALLPPLPRPDLGLLRAAGFSGDDGAVLAAAAARDSQLLRQAASSAFMWTANAATVIPSTDSGDGRCHLVPANLVAMPHRAREAAGRAGQFRSIFRDPARVAIHDPLPSLPALGDEGAANHTRLHRPGMPALHVFVHGREGEGTPGRYPARQAREASVAVARLGTLPEDRALHLRQHPAAIDAGAFHNDVVMVGDGDVVLVHERAWADQPAAIADLRRRMPGLVICEVTEAELPLAEAVASYLFNSQLLSLPAGRTLVAPAQAGEGRSGAVLRRLRDLGVVAHVELLDLGESMANGGGPACLRLRVPLTAGEIATVAPGALLDAQRIAWLEGWIDRHYRAELTAADLADPALLGEGVAALAELAGELGIPVPATGR
jgi:succinylarginine dihydrolase